MWLAAQKAVSARLEGRDADWQMSAGDQRWGRHDQLPTGRTTMEFVLSPRIDGSDESSLQWPSHSKAY